MPCKNLSFLVVEDHEFQRRGLVQLLTNLGAKIVYGAGDGQAALKAIEAYESIDIVICDVTMPGMDGMEFIRRWSERGDPTSLIVMSAISPDVLAMVANMALAYKVRLLGVVAKPPTAAKLEPLIELHRQRGAAASSPANAFSFDEITHAWTGEEFECWWEPHVNLESGAFSSMGAVARWRHPDKGVLEPEVFLASIHARGLQDDFAWMQLQRAAAQCRRWQLEGRALTVSVQLGFESLADVRLSSRIHQIVQAEQLDPKSMVLALPESALCGPDLAKVLENLARLRLLGFGLAVDDFGKGLMSVDQLSVAAFTELRIRVSFVEGADRNATARAGLAVALETAQRLAAQPVAMGIGSKEEWNLLYEWGCRSGAGPFIAAPMEARELPRWMRRWQARQLQSA